MLTVEEKAKLAEIYEPILFHHRDEKFEPISPDRYMSGSAMWCNKPVSPVQFNWGDCSGSGNNDFPNNPLIPRGRLNVDAALAAENGDIFIGSQDADGFRTYQVSNEERQLFIQNLSWSDRTDDPDFLRNVENLASMNGRIEITPSYYVDVLDQESVGAIPRDAATPLPPGFENALRGIYPAGFWVLSYRFFFAFHEEQLTDCEIDSEIIRAKRADEPFAANLHGSYEGDWHAVTVLIPNPGAPLPEDAPTGLPPAPISPLDLADEDFPRPDFVGFSRRARGVLLNIGSGVVDSESFTLMAIVDPSAGEARFTGNHPHAFVSRGTHNMYASPGSNVSPKFDSSLPLPIEAIDTCILADNLDYLFKEVEEVREKVGNVVGKGKKAGIAIGKVAAGAAAGAAVGGPIGAAFGGWGGLLGAAIEGVLDPGPDSIPGQPSPPAGPNNVPDVGPAVNDGDEQPNFGTVIAPSTVAEDLRASLGDEVVAVKEWEGPPNERIIDRTDGVQPWWEPDGNHPQGYRGLWGARVVSDPFDRRSGTRIPAFEALFLNAVLTNQG